MLEEGLARCVLPCPNLEMGSWSAVPRSDRVGRRLRREIPVSAFLVRKRYHLQTKKASAAAGDDFWNALDDDDICAGRVEIQRRKEVYVEIVCR